MKKIVCAAMLIVALTACGGEDTTGNEAGPAVESSAEASSAPPVEEETVALDAEAVVERLRAAGVPIVSTNTVTAENDPNNLLGRPNGYTSKVEITDERVPEAERSPDGGVDNGASVEVFADAAAAQARADFIAEIAKSSPALANEYDYVRGPVLVRVTGKLTPAEAKIYETAVAELPA